MTQLALSGIAVELGAERLLQDLTLTVARGEKWGVVGRNGSGKTTLFRLITGEAAPAAGTIAQASGLRLSVMEQHRDFGAATTVWAAAAGGFADLLALERSLADQTTAMAEAGERCTPEMLARYDRDLARFEHQGGYTLAARIDAVLHGLGFDPDAARTAPVDTLSGGERGRLALVHQLVAPADVLLLDEPTNHLDLETTRWLEQYLRDLDATVLLISHDRSVLQSVVDHVLHLEGGTGVSYQGGYEAFLRQRAERRLAQDRAFVRQSRSLAAEEDFIRRNLAGSNSAQAKGRRRRLARVSRLSPPPGDEEAMALRLTAEERGADQVLVAEDVMLSVGSRTLLAGFSARVQRGEVIGLIGANGAGKSTLLRAIAGERPVDGGTLRLPESVRIAYYRQDLAQVPADETLYDIIGHLRPHWGRGAIQSHLGRFGFSGDTVLRRAGSLSGGERARVALAMMMLSGANLLLFDEPTNHLDVESIEALEDAIEAFGGTVLVVSHDRALLRGLTTRVWVLAQGRIREYPGSFDEWEASERERERRGRMSAPNPAATMRSTPRRLASQVGTGRSERQRGAAPAVEEAEAVVERWENRVRRLRDALEDPQLYETGEGARRATEIVRELTAARERLEEAFAAWEALLSDFE